MKVRLSEAGLVASAEFIGKDLSKEIFEVVTEPRTEDEQAEVLYLGVLYGAELKDMYFVTEETHELLGSGSTAMPRIMFEEVE